MVAETILEAIRRLAAVGPGGTYRLPLLDAAHALEAGAGYGGVRLRRLVGAYPRGAGKVHFLMEGRRETIQVRCYTSAHRTSLVIRKLGDFRLPTPVTIPQAGAIAFSFLLMWNTRNLWGFLAFGNGVVRFLILASVPVGIGLVVRYAKVEGRKPHQAAIGLLSAYLLQPLGRAARIRNPRPARARWAPHFSGPSSPGLTVAPAGKEAARAHRERTRKRKADASGKTQKPPKPAKAPRIKVRRR